MKDLENNNGTATFGKANIARINAFVGGEYLFAHNIPAGKYNFTGKIIPSKNDKVEFYEFSHDAGVIKVSNIAIARMRIVAKDYAFGDPIKVGKTEYPGVFENSSVAGDSMAAKVNETGNLISFTVIGVTVNISKEFKAPNCGLAAILGYGEILAKFQEDTKSEKAPRFEEMVRIGKRLFNEPGMEWEPRYPAHKRFIKNKRNWNVAAFIVHVE